MKVFYLLSFLTLFGCSDSNRFEIQQTGNKPIFLLDKSSGKVWMYDYNVDEFRNVPVSDQRSTYNRD